MAEVSGKINALVFINCKVSSVLHKDGHELIANFWSVFCIIYLSILEPASLKFGFLSFLENIFRRRDDYWRVSLLLFLILLKKSFVILCLFLPSILIEAFSESNNEFEEDQVVF